MSTPEVGQVECQWCRSSTDNLRRATGDPTATATCTHHAFTNEQSAQDIYDAIRAPGPLARLREIHHPMDEEAEFWFDQESGPSAHCPPDCTYDTCNGHTVTIQVCQECGYDHDGDQPVFRPWPCRTFILIGELHE